MEKRLRTRNNGEIYFFQKIYNMIHINDVVILRNDCTKLFHQYM